MQAVAACKHMVGQVDLRKFKRSILSLPPMRKSSKIQHSAWRPWWKHGNYGNSRLRCMMDSDTLRNLYKEDAAFAQFGRQAHNPSLQRCHHNMTKASSFPLKALTGLRPSSNLQDSFWRVGRLFCKLWCPGEPNWATLAVCPRCLPWMGTTYLRLAGMELSRCFHGLTVGGLSHKADLADNIAVIPGTWNGHWIGSWCNLFSNAQPHMQQACSWS